MAFDMPISPSLVTVRGFKLNTLEDEMELEESGSLMEGNEIFVKVKFLRVRKVVSLFHHAEIK